MMRKRFLGRRLPLLGFLTALFFATGSAEAETITGLVQDGIGTPLSGARVTLTSGGISVQAVTGDDGTFSLDAGPATTGRLQVVAEGFSPLESNWSAGDKVVLTLSRVPFVTEVTVTASRVAERLGDTPARVVILSETAVRESPSTAIDDVLRQVPGFSLFRRMGSRAANPTAQGASLRGVGPSGASRTLVLLDGVPLNDPFGGWVYWSRVPRTAVERIEVLEGGASDLYGSAALGGVIQILTKSAERSLNAELHAGGQGTGGGSIHGSITRNRWTARAIGEVFTTDGWIVADPATRGPIDDLAGSRHVVGTLGIERSWEQGLRLFARGSGFGEERTNGTPLQDNDTERYEASVGLDWPRPTGAFSLRAWTSDQTYDQTFSAVSADRRSETLVRSQNVPTDASGGSIVWSHSLGTSASLVTGLEGRIVSGHSDEAVYVGGRLTSFVDGGGEERTVSGFGHLRTAVGAHGVVSLGLRADRWSNRDGRVVSTPAAGGIPSITTYADRASTRLSPRASFLFRAAAHLRVTAAAYGSFRGPTLNELYRSFRVGDTLTQANAKLVEEHLRGAEAGIAWSLPDERARLRGVVFRSIVDDPVANVTQTATPTLITRERRNLGQTRSQGLSLEGEAALGTSWRVTAGYTFVDAIIREFSADPSIVGNRVPQVARHHFTFEGRFSKPALLSAVLQLRLGSGQFEDDANRLALGGCFSADARVSRQFSKTIEVFTAAENLTNERCGVGLTPLRTIGPPRLLRVGLRIN